MNVNAVSTSTVQQAVPPASQSTLDYNAFLKLLLTQMRSQDPTEPMESTEYMGQLASFSQVEQAMQTNAKLDSVLAALALNQAEGVIGRTITAPDGTTGTVESLRIFSDGAVAVLENGSEVLLAPGVEIS